MKPLQQTCLLAVAATLLVPASAQKSKPVPSYYGPQPAVEDIDLTMYARIREEGLLHGHVMDFANALMDGIGPRLTGSPNMAAANAWTRDTLTKIGLEDAHLEDWGEFGLGWQQINTWGRIVTPDTEPLWLQASPWSPATAGPVAGDVVLIDPTSAKPEEYKGKLAGKIVLYGAPRATPDLTEPLFTRYTDAELKEMESYPEASARRSGGPPTVVTVQERLRAQAERRKLLDAILAESPAVVITPSRDASRGGGTGIIFDDNGANLMRDVQKGNVHLPSAVMMIEKADGGANPQYSRCDRV